MSLRRIAGRNARRVTGAVQAMMGGEKPDSFLKFLFCADYNTVLSGSDVYAWVSQTGGITAHRPAYYGKSGNPPSLDTSAFSGSRRSLLFDASNTEALIADSGHSIFSGVGDTRVYTIAAHIVNTTDGYILSCGRPENDVTYLGAQSIMQLNQRDDAVATGSVNGPNMTNGVESVIIYSKEGTNHWFWEQGTPYASNPVVGASLGQMTLSHMAFGAMYRSADTWSSYFDGNIRRIGAAPVKCSDAMAASLAAYWLTR